MSPAGLRRYRAERLLRDEFTALRERVLAAVRGRLNANGVRLDQGDLEACYAQAWQGLHAAMLDGQDIVNPPGWLVLVTFRRAIEEHRARCRAHGRDHVLAGTAEALGNGELPGAPAHERDLAAELDDRVRLRQLMEGMRVRLDAREREAAALCYLQGLSRVEAAARMGISEARMRKLMEGRTRGRPGVAGKVGELLDTIRAGRWCQEQGSLMRALAYGVLDPEGERYQVAVLHRSQCPACRAYVLSLRGLAAVLPPALSPLGSGAALSVTGAASGAGAAGAAGAGGGGWIALGGPLTAKLAVGCLLALGVGAGCVALSSAGDGSRRPHRAGHPAPAGIGAGSQLDGVGRGSVASGLPLNGPTPLGRSTGAEAAGGATPAVREFGPERRTALGRAHHEVPAAGARTAARGSPQPSERPALPTTLLVGASPAAGAGTAAEREFSPG